MGFSQRRWRGLIVVALIVTSGFYYYSSEALLQGTPQAATNIYDIIASDKTHFVSRADQFPVTSFIPYPTTKPIAIPKIQAPAPIEDETAKKERLERLAAVRASFIHSWDGYKKNAWMRDEVRPVEGGYRDTFGGWAASLVDSLDTLWVMGLKQEFEIAVKAAKNVDFLTTDSGQINVFETTIRYLGGYLAAYDISDQQYPELLEKAKEVAEMLMGCFDTKSRIPISRWDWKGYTSGKLQSPAQQMIVSELGSFSLEFTRLYQITKEAKYYDAIQRISDLLEEHQNRTKLPGMWPVIVDAATPNFARDGNFHIGGMSDSLYEYLPKQWLLLGGVLDQSRKMYEKFMVVAREHLVYRPLNPDNLDILIAGSLRVTDENKPPYLEARGEHLTCFAGGMFAMAGKIFDKPDDVVLGRKITEGCIWSYDAQTSGIGPEIFTAIKCDKGDKCVWDEKRWYHEIMPAPPGMDATEATQKALSQIEGSHLAPGFTSYPDRRYILRPEAIESVWYMYRITGDKKYADAAWRMFKAVEKATKTDIASSAIADMTSNHPLQTDSMESFWLAETLKYFYLCFADWNVLDLDVWVLNTEAHPFRRPQVDK